MKKNKKVDTDIKKNKQVDTDIKDGKKCSECDVRYEKPHWVEVLCVDCFEAYLKDSIKPDLPKASGVQL